MTTTGARRRMTLAENVGAQVRAQRLGDAHAAVGLLVMLEETDDRAREGDAGTVQRVHEARLFPRARAIADVGPPRLEVEEVRAGRHLEPLPDSRSPQLEVVGLRARETGIAAREQEHAIGKLQQLQHSL